MTTQLMTEALSNGIVAGMITAGIILLALAILKINERIMKK